MEGILMICAIALETAGLVLLIRRVLRLERRLEYLSTRSHERLDTLEQVIAELDSDDLTALEAHADDRKRAREAERRFTEGVANILNFSCAAGGRKGEV
jgi:hypothetical protein